MLEKENEQLMELKDLLKDAMQQNESAIEKMAKLKKKLKAQ